MAEKLLLNEDNKLMIVQCATFSKSINPRNINNNNDILLRTHGPYHRHKNTKSG